MLILEGSVWNFFFFFFLVCVSFNLYISVRERNDLETTNQSVL